MLHSLLNNLHYGNRFLILAALVFVLYRSWSGWMGKKPFEKMDKTGSLILLILADTQLLVGIVMFWFTSAYTRAAMADMGAAMKDPWLRYFTVEHSVMMLLAIVLIHVGYSLSKKAATDLEKHKKLAIYITIALLVVVSTLSMRGILFNSLEVAAGKQ